MPKRKLSQDLQSYPHASVFGDDPTPGRHRKRLFRSKTNNQAVWTPEGKRDMSELLEFVLQHEEAFKRSGLHSGACGAVLTFIANNDWRRCMQTSDNNSR